MQSRTRFLIHNIAYDMWLNRMADGLTKNMYAGIWFKTLAEAEQWMQGSYAPENQEDYEIQETVTTMEVVENVPQERIDQRVSHSISEV